MHELRQNWNTAHMDEFYEFNFNFNINLGNVRQLRKFQKFFIFLKFTDNKNIEEFAKILVNNGNLSVLLNNQVDFRNSW